MKVLLIEDDSLLGQGIQLNLQQRNYQVDWVQTGEAGIRACHNLDPELIVLDLNLPDIDGIQVLQRIRRAEISTPVIILTARDAIEQRIEGLNSGADDYLVKPFDINELDARLQAIYRRLNGRSDATVKYRDIEINTVSRQVMLAGVMVETGRREYDLLLLLLDNSGRVLTRSKIEDTLYSEDLESNALEVHVHNLRKKFGKSLIKTVRGVGYYVEG